MKISGRWRRTIEHYEHGPGYDRDRGGLSVTVLDQTELPHQIAWRSIATLDETCEVIRDMIVRGAPLIGATAAWGVALAVAQNIDIYTACAKLEATRPTAINLQWALRRMRDGVKDTAGPERLARARELAIQICDDDVATCEAIGHHGVGLLRAVFERTKQPVNVLTHCNAGWLATVDWGTALAPIYRAHEDGIPVHVWVDETRPRNQGLLTAWELAQHGVPHTVIADNAGGHYLQRGRVDLCIVGTDRTTRTGDVCNKIGTYLKALAAHDNRVPFYVAAPSSSIDWTLSAGADIPIEERSGDELRKIRGVEIMTPETAVANPAFDVTPARLVTAIITERGIAAPSELLSLFPESA
jgi:methylthioribose-1-phosphate isomerase